MFNSATLVVILLYILSAILFTSTTVSIAIYYAKRKADTEEKTLITKNDYQKTILIFSIINFIASFVAMALPHITNSGNYNHISIAQLSYLSLILAILAAGVVEFLLQSQLYSKDFPVQRQTKRKEPQSLPQYAHRITYLS